MNAIIKTLAFSLLVVSLGVFAEEKPVRKKEKGPSERYRILKAKPRRFQGENRQENLNDIEVREILAATQTIYPREVVTIDAVKSECPCEDGASCDAQVWVVVYKPGKTDGLMLSRIEGRWTVGPLQKWWLKYEPLQLEQSRYFRSPPHARVGDINVIQKKLYALWNQFPVCPDSEAGVMNPGSKS
ncbi:hypothetical protein [Microbulbifer agarilyticus]|uniref:hypothetical protein n=1 Tax=Microbulbifer agarilyticus TaxID=260552 RepID=UPI001CD7519A|nr:hypothetical protein [Microbulbifer agarilyticus]MCA0894812.1 hypothetical protein [Microbulbifer agarilyticus]